MKTPPEPIDPLTQSLLEDAYELAQAGAAEARLRRRVRMIFVRVATALVFILAAAIWYTKNSSHREAASQFSNVSRSVKAADFAAHSGYLRAYHMGEPVEDTIAQDATEQEKQLVKELPDVPLLLVHNEAGQLTRVHVFESSR